VMHFTSGAVKMFSRVTAKGPQSQSRQQAYNLYNKLILVLTLTLTLTDTGGAVLTLMLVYRKFKI